MFQWDTGGIKHGLGWKIPSPSSMLGEEMAPTCFTHNWDIYGGFMGFP